MIYLDNTRGENSRVAKLNEAKVRQIRKIYDAGGRGAEHAHKFGIAERTFNNVGRRSAWKHVTNEK